MVDYIELENSYSMDFYPKRDIVITRGEGAVLWDIEGKRYIDCAGGHGVASVGHCNEKVAEAIEEQSRKLITCPSAFHNDQRAAFLEKLIGVAPSNMKKAFLCSSGAESVEAALKFARLTTKRTGFVCAMRSFHGRTMGALSATYPKKYKKDFLPLVPDFEFAPFNNLEKMDQLVGANTAAVLLEPVQGEGGIHLGNNLFFEGVRKLCSERGALLIVDEIQTGFCRTGKFFAIEHFNVEADIICLAKAIAGGVPMGAVLCSEKIKDGIGLHGSTFGGNPLSCAAATAALDFMVENNLAAQAEEKGKRFIELLTTRSLKSVRQIRGLGLMIGIELKQKVKPVLMKLMEDGVIALPAGSTVLRLLPPLVISNEDLESAAEKVIEVLS